MKWPALGLAFALAGCDTLSYYGHAVSGHRDLAARAQPLATLIADPRTPQPLRAKLQSAREIRSFATRELGLPDNASYTSYADLGRRYAVWNVYAAPEFSVEPRTECFPFAGCVAYRGFFDEGAARAHAARLQGEGHDVFVAGVPAYSTLGWFDDPLLSTFIGLPDAEIARLVFHELAHQLIYVKDDTAFNESFAVAVEQEGVRRWLEATGRARELAAFRQAQERRREFTARVEESRKKLAVLYQLRLAPEAMRERKRAEFERLRAGSETLVPPEPNNAFLASVAIYTQLVPAFERLLAASRGDLAAFYARVRQLAALDAAARAAALR